MTEANPLEGLLEIDNGVDVADALRLAILDGTLPPGTRLLQPQIAQVFGISRTPVREALHKLNGWGLVDLVVNRTAEVRHVRRDHYASAFVVWAELGALAIELAAEHGRDVADQVRAVVQDEWEIVDATTAGGRSPVGVGEHWIAAQRAFHQSVLDGSGSVRLRETIATTTDLLTWEAIWKAVDGRPYPLRSAALRHEEIVVLLHKREADAASDCMRQHIIELGDAFLASFQRTVSDRADRNGN